MIKIVFIILGVLYIIGTIIIGRITVRRHIVFAGSPNANEYGDEIEEVKLPKNNPIYKIGDTIIDVSKCVQLIVKGKSLEPEGINDGCIVFANEISLSNTDIEALKKLVGRFIILKIDNERTLQEHPLKQISIVTDGLKLRKVVKIIDVGLTNEQKENEIRNFLKEKDDDYGKLSDIDENKFYDGIKKKYDFASQYYNNDRYLIMSITYPKGGDKNYSFHSPKYLYGIVEFTSKK